MAKLSLVLVFTIFLGAKTILCLQGGKDVSPEEFPYLALIQKNNETICMGLITQPNQVASAAACFEDYANPANFTVIPFVNGEPPFLYTGKTVSKSGVVGNETLKKLDVAYLALEAEMNVSSSFNPNATESPVSSLYSVPLNNLNDEEWLELADSAASLLVVGSNKRAGVMNLLKNQECLEKLADAGSEVDSSAAGSNQTELGDKLVCAVASKDPDSADGIPPGNPCATDLGAPLIHNGRVVGLLIQENCKKDDNFAVFLKGKLIELAKPLTPDKTLAESEESGQPEESEMEMSSPTNNLSTEAETFCGSGEEDLCTSKIEEFSTGSKEKSELETTLTGIVGFVTTLKEMTKIEGETADTKSYFQQEETEETEQETEGPDYKQVLDNGSSNYFLESTFLPKENDTEKELSDNEKQKKYEQQSSKDQEDYTEDKELEDESKTNHQLSNHFGGSGNSLEEENRKEDSENVSSYSEGHKKELKNEGSVDKRESDSEYETSRSDGEEDKSESPEVATDSGDAENVQENSSALENQNYPDFSHQPSDLDGAHDSRDSGNAEHSTSDTNDEHHSADSDEELHSADSDEELHSADSDEEHHSADSDNSENSFDSGGFEYSDDSNYNEVSDESDGEKSESESSGDEHMSETDDKDASSSTEDEDNNEVSTSAKHIDTTGPDLSDDDEESEVDDYFLQTALADTSGSNESDVDEYSDYTAPPNFFDYSTEMFTLEESDSDYSDYDEDEDTNSTEAGIFKVGTKKSTLEHHNHTEDPEYAEKLPSLRKSFSPSICSSLVLLSTSLLFHYMHEMGQNQN